MTEKALNLDHLLPLSKRNLMSTIPRLSSSILFLHLLANLLILAKK